GEEGGVRGGGGPDDVDVPAAPERALERARGGLHGPRSVGDGTVAPDAAEDQAEVPVGHLVAEEEEVAAAELRRQTDRYRPREVCATEVVDVVVLRDDEALPLALGVGVDRAPELQQHGAALQRKLRRVRVGDVDRAWRLAGRAMPEPAAMGTGRYVRDDVDLLPGLGERLLEREVVVGRDDERVGGAVLPRERRQRGQKPVQRSRLERRLEVPVQ